MQRVLNQKQKPGTNGPDGFSKENWWCIRFGENARNFQEQSIPITASL